MVKRCKSNEKRIKSYSRSSGVKVKGHCRVSKKCSRGKKYRKSYTRKSGKKVKGHCVSSSRRSSRKRISRKKSRKTSKTRPLPRSSTSRSYSREEQPYRKTYEKSSRPPSMDGVRLSKQERPDYERKYDEDEGEARPSYFSENQKQACVKLFQKYGLWNNSLDIFRKNFRQWSLRNHPDKNPDMADTYGEVSSCYKDILKHVWNVSF